MKILHHKQTVFSPRCSWWTPVPSNEDLAKPNTHTNKMPLKIFSMQDNSKTNMTKNDALCVDLGAADTDKDKMAVWLGGGGVRGYHDALWFFFPAGSEDGKSICLQCRRPRFDPWVRKIPWRRKWWPHSSSLAWRIPQTEEEPGRLQSMGLQRVGHDWVTLLRKWNILSGKGQIFAEVSALWATRRVATTQLCCCKTKAVVDNTLKKKKTVLTTFQ